MANGNNIGGSWPTTTGAPNVGAPYQNAFGAQDFRETTLGSFVGDRLTLSQGPDNYLDNPQFYSKAIADPHVRPNLPGMILDQMAQSERDAREFGYESFLYGGQRLADSEAASRGMYDQAEQEALRGSQQDYARNLSSGLQSLSRQGLGQSSRADQMSLANAMQRQTTNRDIIGSFAAQRAQETQKHANAMVDFLTGVNVGTPDAGQAFNMFSSFGQSGVGGGDPDYSGGGIFDFIGNLL